VISLRFKKLKIRENSITITRRIIQILAFLIINYLILEAILPINLLSLEGLIKVLPILNSPRNPLSKGGGILEYIFFSMAEGVFPFFLIAVLLLVLLFSNRFFCGWICPIGAIQDACAAIPTKKKKFKIQTHKTLLNIKYVLIIITIIIIFPLGITKNANILFYLDFKNQLGTFAQQPIGYFSLSEFIFVYFPYLVQNIFLPAQFGALDFGGYIILFFFSSIIVLSVWYPRIYCRYICPFAAISSAVSEYSFLKLATGKGECNLCLECKEKCPYDAIDLKFGSV